MKSNSLKLIFLILLFIFFQTNCFAFDYSRYKEISITKLIKNHIDEQNLYRQEAKIPEYDPLYAPAGLEPYKVSLIYEGDTRELSSDTKNYLDSYFFKTFPDYKKIKENLSKEMKFSLKGKVYWFMVQDVLIPYFKSEIKQGENVHLYVVFLGNIDHSFYFLINEFSK